MDKKQTNDYTGFATDPDVSEMLSIARAAGMKIKYLCNQALREYLAKRGFKKGSK